MEIIIPAGYQITTVSWENDADNYQTNTVNSLSEDQVSETLGVVLRDKLKEYFDITQEKSQKERQ